MQKKVLLLFIIGILYGTTFSQTISNQKVFHYTISNGLSNGKIHQIIQDKQGFIWVATQNGLTRYDGYNSKRYTSVSDSNKYGISHNYVYSVAPAMDGGIWVGTMAGVDKYDYATGKFHHFNFYTQEKKQILKSVWQIIPRKDGSCIFRSDSRDLYIVTSKSDTIVEFKYKNYKSKAIISALDTFGSSLLVGDKSGMIYKVSDNGSVTIIDNIGKQITSIKTIANLYIIVADIQGTIYVYKNNKRINTYNFPSLLIAGSEKYISTIIQDTETSVYIGTRGSGMYKLYLDKGWVIEKDINPLLINAHIETICKDKNNNVWIGHSYGGVSLSHFQYQSLQMLDCPQEVFSHKILSIYLRNNILYIGTDGNGLYIYNKLTKNLEHYNLSTGFKGNVFDNVITSMHADETHLWLSTYNKGIYAINFATNTLDFTSDLIKIPVQNTSNVYNDNNNCIWIGTYDSGVYVYNKLKKQIQTFYSTQKNALNAPITCDGVTCFLQDSKQNIWIGTYYGISKITSKGDITNYNNYVYPGLKNNYVTSICQDEDGELWIGSAQGVSKYIYSTDSIVEAKISSKIDNNPIHGISIIENDLWFVTTHAIYKYNKNNKKLDFKGSTNIGELSRDGTAKGNSMVYFAAERGIVCYDLLQKRKDKVKNSLQLTDILIQGKSLFSELTDYEASVENNEFHISLPSKEDNITFFFTDFSFEKYIEDEYEYILENYMDSWASITDVNFVNFTKLPGGEYVFKVRKKESNGETVEELRVHLHIQKAFWEYWFFYIFLIVLLIFVVYVIYSIRIKRVLYLKNQLQEQVEERVAEIKSQIELISVQEDKINKLNETNFLQTQEIELQKQLIINQKDEFEALLEQKERDIEIEKNKKEDFTQGIEQTNKNLLLLENFTNEMVFRILLPSEDFDYVSPGSEKITGYTPQEFYDDSMIFRKLVVSEGKDDFKKFRKYMIEGKVPPIMEYKIVKKNNNELWVAQYNKIIKDNKNQVVALEAVLVDISYKKELELRTLSANSRSKKMNIITDVLQEQNSENKSKNTMALFCELLKQEDISLDEQRGFLENNPDNSTYLLQFISDLVDLAKIEEGKLHLNYSQCYVNTMFQELHDAFLIQKNEIHKKNVALELEITILEENFTFYTDTFRFRQIMLNLIGNALKYTSHGRVVFGYELVKNNEIESNYDLVFYVKDTGPGISEENIQKIYNSSIQKDNNFAGIGLTVSYKLVQLLGGKMWITSEQNKGCVIKFILPMEKMKGLKKIDSSKSEVVQEIKDWSNKTLLLAEDEENNYDLVREVLTKTKIQIIWAQDGEQAVEVFKNNRREIDIILMDIQMPVMNGYNATQEIKKIDKDIPIIAQTAYANYESKLNCIKVGCDNYIEKPYKKKDLIELLAKYL